MRDVDMLGFVDEETVYKKSLLKNRREIVAEQVTCFAALTN